MDSNDTNGTKGMLGCLVLVLEGAFALFASIAVGIFFGAGFGVLAYAAFLAVAALICLAAFGKVK